MSKLEKTIVPEVEEVKDTTTEVTELERLRNEIAILKQMMEESKATTVAVEEDKPTDINSYLNEKVPFFAFRDNDRYKDDIHVGVNGYNYVIQRGVTVMVPRFVKNILEDAERQSIEASRHSQNLIDQFSKATKERGIDI